MPDETIDYFGATTRAAQALSAKSFCFASLLQIVALMFSIGYSVLMFNELDSIDGTWIATLLGIPVVLGETACAGLTCWHLLDSEPRRDRALKCLLFVAALISVVLPIALIAAHFLRSGPLRGSVL